MKAKTQYSDFTGTVAADICDILAHGGGDDLKSIGRFFKLDQQRFKLIGLSIYGTQKLNLSLVCVDNEKSNPEKDYIVSMSVENSEGFKILDHLFKRLHIVLHEKNDEKYPRMDFDDYVVFNDFH